MTPSEMDPENPLEKACRRRFRLIRCRREGGEEGLRMHHDISHYSKADRRKKELSIPYSHVRDKVVLVCTPWFFPDVEILCGAR
jgi:hypothetical protein